MQIFVITFFVSREAKLAASIVPMVTNSRWSPRIDGKRLFPIVSGGHSRGPLSLLRHFLTFVFTETDTR